VSRAGLVLLALLAVTCGGDPGVAEPPDADQAPAPDAAVASGDGFPEGAIAFFLGTGCPSGWSPFAEGAGRTVVPSAGAEAGTAVGVPQAGNERRAHRHELAVAVELPSISFAGIAGEANHGVARSGVVQGASTTDPGEADLPYVQLLICTRTAPSSGRRAPSGVVAFFAEDACPAPWREAASALRGRLLIGLPADGVAGETFGGAPLTAGEVRTHTHPVSASLGGASHGIALASGCCASGYAAAGPRATTAAAAAAPVDLPYVQLLACVAP
jgi:hypothetical protein